MNKNMFFGFLMMLIFLASNLLAQRDITYPILDTRQEFCYNDTESIPCPEIGSAFYGQDAQFDGHQPAYTNNGDGTISDDVSGLMWQKTPALYDKMTFAEAVAGADTFSLAGYTDWRLPSIKELYSLIIFTGSSQSLSPFIDTLYFDFRFGDPELGERVIDGQYWSSTAYVGTTMNGDATVFGVNFADGRIKGYPRDMGPGGEPHEQFVRYVRGNPDYGKNDFVNNNDGTITDHATGLMWQKSDSEFALNWQEALAYSQGFNLAGYEDWRLPNAKELQSIVDYTHAPDAVNPAQKGPAIDTVFDMAEEEAWYYTNTTLLESPPEYGPGSQGVYICFGLATGWMEQPPGSGNYTLLNVHGAGAQRSDFKSGNPDDFPHGFGPQGDVVRIYNYVRLVRDAEVSTSIGSNIHDINQIEVFPNPARDVFTVRAKQEISMITIYNMLGEKLMEQKIESLQSQLSIDYLPSGIYLVQLGFQNSHKYTKKLIVE